MTIPIIQPIFIWPHSQQIIQKPMPRGVDYIKGRMSCRDIVTYPIEEFKEQSLVLVVNASQHISAHRFAFDGIDGQNSGIACVVALEEQRAATPICKIEWIIERVSWVSGLGKKTPAV